MAIFGFNPTKKGKGKNTKTAAKKAAKEKLKAKKSTGGCEFC